MAIKPLGMRFTDDEIDIILKAMEEHPDNVREAALTAQKVLEDREFTSIRDAIYHQRTKKKKEENKHKKSIEKTEEELKAKEPAPIKDFILVHGRINFGNITLPLATYKIEGIMSVTMVTDK